MTTGIGIAILQSTQSGSGLVYKAFTPPGSDAVVSEEVQSGSYKNSELERYRTGGVQIPIHSLPLIPFQASVTATRGSYAGRVPTTEWMDTSRLAAGIPPPNVLEMPLSRSLDSKPSAGYLGLMNAQYFPTAPLVKHLSQSMHIQAKDASWAGRISDPYQVFYRHLYNNILYFALNCTNHLIFSS